MKTNLNLKGILCLLMITGIAISCHDEIPPTPLSLDDQLAQEGLTRTKLGKQLENPYSIENMTLALDTLQKILNGVNPKGRSLAEEITLETTDLYVRFLPRDTTQYNDMLKDTTMIYYDHPLDYEIEQQGDVYIDTTAVEGQIGWQYTVVKPDFIFADTLEYEILSELFIPENHPDYVEDEDDEELTNGRINNMSQLLGQLETMSLYLSDNLSEEEKQQINEQNTNGKVMGWFWNRPSRWRPSGRIRIQDTELGWKPMQGVKVQARRWFTTKTGYTNASGYYSCNGRFRRPANYKIIWERYQFSIREEGWWFFTRQAWVNGPKRKGDWNLDIPKYTERWFHGTIFQAAYHYYYQYIKGLRRPPQNSFWKPQMKISARNSTNSSSNGNHAAWRRVLGILSRIKIWRNNRDSDEIYATTIHELAHASHWDMGRGNFNNTQTKVKESWARGVQWDLTRMKYAGYRGGATIRPYYTQVVVDMIDGPRDDNNGSENSSEDNVSGYTIRQIEDALRGQRTWNGWGNNIKNRYNNATESNLDQLFDHWN